jgi:hypothetical protein
MTKLRRRLRLEPLEERRLLAVCDPNDDDEVTRADVAILAIHYGIKEGATDREGDCNEDGSINLLDVGLMQAQLRARRLDWGDAPDRPYPTRFDSDGARHVIREGFHLGDTIDRDPNGQPSADAKGDDGDADGDDEDGVFFETVPTPGDRERVRVVASGAGRLDAWADWNRDGDWDDPGEQTFTSEPLVAGPNLLTYLVPPEALTDRDRPTYARFRFSTAGGLSPKGLAEDGEVEDYALFVLRPSDVPPPVDVPTLWDWEMHLEDISIDPPRSVMSEAVGPVVVRFAMPVHTDTGQPFSPPPPATQRFLDIPPIGPFFIDTELLAMNLTGTVFEPASPLGQPVTFTATVSPTASSGGTLLTPLPSGGWHIDSFFDITYRVDLENGMSLVPQDGSMGLVADHDVDRVDVGLLLKYDGIDSLGEPLVDINPPHAVWDIVRKVTTQVPQLDWGDAADGPYPTLAASAGAAHVIRSGYSMGPAVDPDANGQPHPISEGDDADADGDDEDGVAITSAIFPGGVTTVDVTAVGGKGFLNAWADFNRNGAWDPAEQIFTNVLLNVGVNGLAFPVPAATAPDAAGNPPVISRWRFSRQKGLPTTGLSSSGDVEDHLLRIEQPPAATLDFGDAPDKPYPTLTASNGASHKVVPGFHLGRSIDAEPDGQPDLAALRDDANGAADDEDGVTFMTPHVPGSASTVLVEASAPGRLDAWFDFNHNGVWESGVEHAFGNFSLVAGPNTISFNVPNDAVGGRTYARLRFSSEGGLRPEGEAPDGEVEDYAIIIEPAAASRTIVQTNQSDLDVLRGRVSFAPATIGPVLFGSPGLGDVPVPLWTQVLVPGVESVLGDIGKPAVPVYQRLVAIPMGAKARIVPFIEQDNIITLSDIDLLPFQPTALDGEAQDPPIPPLEFFGDPTDFALDAATYGENAPFPREIARFVPLGKMRDLEVGLIQIATGQYNPVTRELSLFRVVDFSIEFTDGMRGFLPPQANNPFENIRAQYAGVLNAEAVFDHILPGELVLSDCTFSQLGEELLILTHPDFRDAADLLHDWKEDKGIVTTVFEVGEGTARDTKEEIYDLIKERFDECTIRPSYLLLLGDTEFIETWYRHTRYAGGDGGPDVKKNQDLSSGQWVSLGTAYFNADGTESVVLIRPDRDDNSPDFGDTVADAVKFRNLATNTEVIVDNQDAGFSTTGTWIESSATDEFDGSSLISNTDDSTATFEPTLADEGLHEVYAWWSADSPYGGTFNRDSTAIYRIKSSNTGTDTPYVYVADGFFNILPDLANGRIPVDTLQQALDVVNKIIQYEQDPPGSFADPMDEFYDTATVASQFQGYRSGDPTGRDLRGFIEVSEQARNTLLADGRTVERIYGKTEGDNPGQAPPNRYYNGALLPADLRASSGFPWDGDAQDVIDAFNDGRFLITHRDHGGPGGWGTPGFNRDHVSNNLNNGELLPVVYSVNCASGIFDNETSGTLTGTSTSGSYFSERLIRLAGEGAVGVIGDTRNSNTWSNAAFYTGLIDATWTDNDPGYGSDTAIRRLGDIMNYAKEYTLSQIGVAGTLPEVDIDVAVDTLFLYHVFGDPTLEMWISNPNPVILPRDITIGPIVDPKVLTLTYGENGEGDGATLTIFQEIRGVLTPLGRGTVANGVARVPLFLEGDPDQPFIIGACRDDAVCVMPAVQQRLDFGDAPDVPYPTLLVSNGARHTIRPGFHLGPAIDRDPNGQPNAGASGDDADADGDDEDGVFYLTAAVPGMPQRVRVDASAPGRLDAFVDFNRDGDWDDEGETIFSSQPLAAGSNFLSYTLPATAIADPTRPTYARFRFSSAGGLTPRGPALDGEVEDYTLFIVAAANVPAVTRHSFVWDAEADLARPNCQAGGTGPPCEVVAEASGPAEMLFGPAINTDNGMAVALGGPGTTQPLPDGSWHIPIELCSMSLAGAMFEPRTTVPIDDIVVSVAPSDPCANRGRMDLGVENGLIHFLHLEAMVQMQVRDSANAYFNPKEISIDKSVSWQTRPPTMPTFEAIVNEATMFEFRAPPPVDFVPIQSPTTVAFQLTRLHVEIPSRLDWGDAPNPPYPTLAASAGARHVIRTGYSLGPAVDVDANGQPHPIALGDDGDADGDDEDGVVTTSPIFPGSVTTVNVTAVGGRGYLNGWADFNRNGAWEASEHIFTDVLLNVGVNTLTFSVPSATVPDSATVLPVISRWRFSRQSGLPTTGLSSSGEIEDHLLRIAQRPAGSPEAPAAVLSVVGVDRVMGNDENSTDAVATRPVAARLARTDRGEGITASMDSTAATSSLRRSLRATRRSKDSITQLSYDPRATL